MGYISSSSAVLISETKKLLVNCYKYKEERIKTYYQLPLKNGKDQTIDIVVLDKKGLPVMAIWIAESDVPLIEQIQGTMINSSVIYGIIRSVMDRKGVPDFLGYTKIQKNSRITFKPILDYPHARVFSDNLVWAIIQMVLEYFSW